MWGFFIYICVMSGSNSQLMCLFCIIISLKLEVYFEIFSFYIIIFIINIIIIVVVVVVAHFGTVGGSQSTQRKPRQTQREHTHSAQKHPDRGTKC